MFEHSILAHIRGGLIVSCQASEEEPLHGPLFMARMALAAKIGGAVGIRANGAEDIKAIKEIVDLPVIGILKRQYQGCDVFITPTLREAEELAEAGADIIAIDATFRQRPGRQSVEQFIRQVKELYPGILLMADVSTFAEGERAASVGADIVATTLAGYTPYSAQLKGPDFVLAEQFAHTLDVPVIAEGRIRTPEEAADLLAIGVWSVLVGSAITRPHEITRRFVNRMKRSMEYGSEQ